jgi:sn-glycerol 3-phosphate transport system permease protein
LGPDDEEAESQMKPQSPFHPWIMLSATLALLLVFFIVPIGVAAFESFFSWDLLTPPRYVGAANYRALATHGSLLHVAVRTLGYSLLVVVGTMSLGLALALLVDRPGRAFAFVRASIFSAYVVSWVGVALLWMWMLDANGGIAGHVMSALGAPSVSFFGDPRCALAALAAIGIWKLTGYAMILFLAGLQSIPPSLHEAAALDGARGWGRFRHVTLPLLAPTAAFVATTTLVTSFQAFDIVRIVTQGGPAHATQLFVYAIYEQIFLNLSVGRASALAVVFFSLLFALASLQLRAWRAGEGAAS